MSHEPKIVEIQEFINRNEVDLACITETWLKDVIPDSVVDIPGYTIIRRDRQNIMHGGVCLYVKNDNNFKYQRLNDIKCCDQHEILWVQLTPKRLPRGFSSIVVCIVYHPQQSCANDHSLREHLFDTLTTVEARFPSCALIVCGDFNRFNTNSLTNHFRLKQIVRVPTRKDAILDLIMTNLTAYYNDPITFPPFGLSDHETVLVTQKHRVKSSNPTKYILRRDTRPSRRAELGRYLSSFDWPLLFTSLETCDELECALREAILTGLDIIMPLERVRLHTKDAPWMTPELKSLIIKRQKYYHQFGASSIQYRFYRNLVNRKRKCCKAKFYESKIQHLKDNDPKRWWSEVKRLSGSSSHRGDLRSQINVADLNNLPPKDLANFLNHELLEPLQDYRLAAPLVPIPLEDSPEFLEVSEYSVFELLSKLDPSKACGPDAIPNWLLKEYAILLAFPICKVLNASFSEQRLPNMWKLADVTPIPKKKPIKDFA
ncbi:uncharacterized protein LOC110239869 [Exaiptasia diaphana]|uniref:Endonuclease/exonuclease/phosphatase domain-containing protein n=1 Tax=Exaiptasia diaphana TaxID=2652724 RepID=A0A913YJ48_EXADI|nr:uncharacterized protein LOC110239869 [Exaiptasia diaphana]